MAKKEEKVEEVKAPKVEKPKEVKEPKEKKLSFKPNSDMQELADRAAGVYKKQK